MSAANLAMVFAPSLIRPKEEKKSDVGGSLGAPNIINCALLLVFLFAVVDPASLMTQATQLMKLMEKAQA